MAGIAADELLRLAASRELGQRTSAVARWWSAPHASAAERRAGRGIPGPPRLEIGSLFACELLVGNRRLLEEQGIGLPRKLLALLDRLDAAGQTVLLVSLNGRVLGGSVLATGCVSRPATPSTSCWLGVLRMVMLTGDRPAAVRHRGRRHWPGGHHAARRPRTRRRFWNTANPRGR